MAVTRAQTRRVVPHVRRDPGCNGERAAETWPASTVARNTPTSDASLEAACHARTFSVRSRLEQLGELVLRARTPLVRAEIQRAIPVGGGAAKAGGERCEHLRCLHPAARRRMGFNGAA